MKRLGGTAFFVSMLCCVTHVAFGQGCCSGGSGNPIAGGPTPGVLEQNQIELAPSFQYLHSNRFLTGDSIVQKQLDSYDSRYFYMRAAYGVSSRLTMSVESGYFLSKTQVALQGADTISSSGIGDLILFPRYDLLNRSCGKTRTAVTVGLGYKIPLGHCNDSTLVYVNPKTGKEYYTVSPPTVQTTTGSHDAIFYGLVFRSYKKPSVRLFANAMYVRTGWNPLGQKFGDYATAGLFVGQTYFEKLGLTLQLKGEWVDKMKHHENVDVLALYNVDVTSTGSRKLSVIPQLQFSTKGFSFYALTELPLYQRVNGTQLGSDVLVTCGASYRFFVVKQ